MSWDLPAIPGTGTVATVLGWATKVVNCFRFLKGLDGTVTLEDGLNLGANELTINSIEIVGVDGEVNKAAVEDHTHQDAVNCGTLDHGLALTGLTDDDHTQYVLKSLLTTQADLPYATGASTWARLAKGSGYQLLRMNAGATSPEWATIAIVTSSGSYTGNGTVNRAIPHGLGVTPKIVFLVISATLSYLFNIFGAQGYIQCLMGGADAFVLKAVTTPDATNFYVGNAADYITSANSQSVSYLWVAIG
jgi:hypothetical protein